MSIQNEFFIVKDRTNSVRQLLSQRVDYEQSLFFV